MPALSPRYWNPQQVTGSAFNPSNSGQGGNGNWNTTSILWSTNGDGTGGTAWTNSTDLSADIGSAVMTLQTDITTGDIVSSNITLTGSYSMTIGYGLSNVTMLADVPVTSTTDTTYGFQAITNVNLNFKKGLYCNAFNFGGPTIISSSLETTSNSITHQISDSLILNCSSTVAGDFLVNSGADLTITSNNTASFNSIFDLYSNDITSNGLLNLYGIVQLSGVPTFKGTGTTILYSNITGDYDLIKTGSGTFFLSASKSSLNTRDIKINEGTFKIKPDTIFNSSNFICSGTLNLLGNTSIIGNVTFATGTLRLGV